MATLGEMELLNRSVGGLADTLTRNRQLRASDEERARRAKLDEAMMAERAGERAHTQATRRESFASQSAHQDRLEKIAAEKNADARTKMGLDFLSQLNKSGQLTEEGLSALNAKINEQMAHTGLAAQLVRKPEAETPKTYYDQDSGEPVADYFKNTILPRKQLPDGDSETIEYDPNSNEPIKRTVRRRLKNGPAAAAPDENAGMETEQPINDTTDVMRELQRGNLLPAWGPPGQQAPQPAAGTGPAQTPTAPTFADEASARAAGHKGGDTVRLVINGKPVLVRLR